MSRETDRELVARLLAGDEAAFESLVTALEGTLVRLARLFVQDTGAAQDVVQETWLAVLRGLARFEGRASLKTWICRILVNRARSRASRDSRWRPLPDLDGGGGEASAPVVDPARFGPRGGWRLPPETWDVHTPEALLLRAEAVAALERALEGLPPAQRAVVTLRDIEGFSAEEVCNILELSESNQRVLLHRGRARLRNALEEALGKARKPSC
jgi:RNA polymerase sigma-70 factor (ECF subfamily)